MTSAVLASLHIYYTLHYLPFITIYYLILTYEATEVSDGLPQLQKSYYDPATMAHCIVSLNEVPHIFI